MSNIDAQIKALLLKKKKIDYVSYIADLVKNDTKCLDFKDVKDEVVSKIEPFLLTLMTSIEADGEQQKTESKSSFDEKELQALKIIASKVLNKAAETPNTPFQPTPPAPTPKKEELSNNDKMNFAMNNRHLANKRVQVINDTNVQVFGLVVGLDAPFILVKTETGPTIQVPLEKVVPV